MPAAPAWPASVAVREGTDDEESVSPRWQLETSRHHALDCEILVE